MLLSKRAKTRYARNNKGTGFSAPATVAVTGRTTASSLHRLHTQIVLLPSPNQRLSTVDRFGTSRLLHREKKQKNTDRTVPAVQRRETGAKTEANTTPCQRRSSNTFSRLRSPSIWSSTRPRSISTRKLIIPEGSSTSIRNVSVVVSASTCVQVNSIVCLTGPEVVAVPYRSGGSYSVTTLSKLALCPIISPRSVKVVPTSIGPGDVTTDSFSTDTPEFVIWQLQRQTPLSRVP
jgi:hypothetical protein